MTKDSQFKTVIKAYTIPEKKIKCFRAICRIDLNQEWARFLAIPEVLGGTLVRII